MPTAVVDNATVSSVQRALGQAQIRDRALLEIEHTALDRFVEAVLFADRVVVPDTYKEAFTPARKRLLSKFGVEMLPVGAPESHSLNEIAHCLTAPWTEAFVEGSERALFSRYFGQVEAFSNFIWEHASSSFYLVFRAHGHGKDSPLIRALLASPSDDSLGRRLRIIARDGGEVAWDDLSRHVRRMLAVMGWLGHQYIWHQAFAAQHELTYSPHPLREFFAHDFLTRLTFAAHTAVGFRDAFAEGLTRFKGKLAKGLDSLGAHPNSYSVNSPNLLPGLVLQSRSSDDFITIVGQLRSDSRVAEIRALLEQMSRDADRGDFRRRRQFLEDIENIGNALAVTLGVESRFLRLKAPTTITGISIEGDDTGVKLPIPSVLYRQYFLTRRYRTFLRDVMADIARPSQYGAVKTKLDSWAWVEEGAEFSEDKFYLKPYRLPSKFHRPLLKASED